MSNDFDKAREYRVRAEELRAVTEWMKDPQALRAMLATALEYDLMASTIEKLAKSGAARNEPDKAH